MLTIILIIVFIFFWNLIFSLISKDAHSPKQSIIITIISFLFRPRINFGQNSLSKQKESIQEVDSGTLNNTLDNFENQVESEGLYFIKPEYSVFQSQPSFKSSHSVVIMGSAVSIEITTNESLTALKGMLDEAISCTANLNQNEASSAISSSIPKCLLSSSDIHAICNQIKSIASKYRFDPARFDNFIQR